MKTQYRESFLRDVRKVKDQDLLGRVCEVIEQVEKSIKLADLAGLRKLKHPGGYFRIKIGDYRCGLRVEDDTVTFVRLLHRKDIYRYFPKS